MPEAQQFPLSLILASRQSIQHETVENKAKTVWNIWWQKTQAGPPLPAERFLSNNVPEAGETRRSHDLTYVEQVLLHFLQHYFTSCGLSFFQSNFPRTEGRGRMSRYSPSISQRHFSLTESASDLRVHSDWTSLSCNSIGISLGRSATAMPPLSKAFRLAE